MRKIYCSGTLINGELLRILVYFQWGVAKNAYIVRKTIVRIRIGFHAVRGSGSGILGNEDLDLDAGF